MNERYELSLERIRLIVSEESVKEPYRDFFQKTAAFILKLDGILDRVLSGNTENDSSDELEQKNTEIYRDVLEEHYKTSYANPAFAVSSMGDEIGKYLGVVYVEIRKGIRYAYMGKKEYLTINNELFVEIYNCFENEEVPNYRALRNILYWYVSDYFDIFVADRIESVVGEKDTLEKEILMQRNLRDLRYLYQYGEYISAVEMDKAEHFNELSETEIEYMAEKYANLFFSECEEAEGKVFSLAYPIGMERVVRKFVKIVENRGFRLNVYREAESLFTLSGPFAEGVFGTDANEQYYVDHAFDLGLILDKKIIERKLEVIRTSFEQKKEMSNRYAGAICFGERKVLELEPVSEAVMFNEKQELLGELYEAKEKLMLCQYAKTNKYLLQEVNTGMVDIQG